METVLLIIAVWTLVSVVAAFGIGAAISHGKKQRQRKAVAERIAWYSNIH